MNIKIESRFIKYENLEYITELYKKYKNCDIIDVEYIFGGTIQENPIAFLLKLLPNQIWQEREGEILCIEPWQIDVLLYIRNSFLSGKKVMRICLCGGKGVGKTDMEAMVLIWSLYVHGEKGLYKAIAGKFSSAKSILFKRIQDIITNDRSLIASNFYIGKSSSTLALKKHNQETPPSNAPKIIMEGWDRHNPSKIAGDHAEFNFYIVDEAPAVADEIITELLGILSNSYGILLLTGNGVDYHCTFSRIMRGERGDRWYTKHISLDDCIRTAVNKEEAYYEYSSLGQHYLDIYYYGLIPLTSMISFFSPADIKNIFDEKKEVLDMYNTLRSLNTIPYEMMTEKQKAAKNRIMMQISSNSIPVLGVDVGCGLGKNATVMIARTGSVAEIMLYSNTVETSVIISRIIEFFQLGYKIAIDVHGAGSMLRRDLKLHNVVYFPVYNDTKHTTQPMFFEKFKDELYFRCREWCRDDTSFIATGVGRNVSNDSLAIMRKEMTEVAYTIEKGKLRISEKENNQTRDCIDALAYTFVHSPTPQGWSPQ